MHRHAERWLLGRRRRAADRRCDPRAMQCDLFRNRQARAVVAAEESRVLVRGVISDALEPARRVESITSMWLLKSPSVPLCQGGKNETARSDVPPFQKREE